MSLPSLADYSEALQNPHLAFSDADLSGASVELTKMGLPRPISGNFATVFRVTTADRKSWAVKCFTRQVDDRLDRYRAVSAAVQSLNAPFLVGFEFVEAGIRVNGNRFPILKMEWVEAELLGTWVERSRYSPERLIAVAAAILAAAEALESAGIAHGDLQHGNVLIDSTDSVRLIDYDGMFVPALAGRSASESGHRNYQHPDRARLGFGSTIDRFSAHVISTSLLALAADPSLWDRFGDAQEHLLFKSDDFGRQHDSAVARALMTLPAPFEAERLEFLRTPIEQLRRPAPPGSRAVVRQLPPPVAQAHPHAATTGLPSWLGSVPPAIPASQTSHNAAAASAGTSSSWIATHLPPLPPQQFSGRPTRWPLIVAAVACAIAAASGLFVAIPVLAAAVWLAVFFQYRREPTVRERERLRNEFNAAEKSHRAASRVAITAEQALTKLVADYNVDRLRLQRELDEARAEASQQRKQIDQELQTTLSSIARRERESDNAAQGRRSAQLKRLQDDHVAQRLGRAQITAKDCGIPAESVRYLQSEGFRFASDLNGFTMRSSNYKSGRAYLRDRHGREHYVYSVGRVRAEKLERWRKALEATARSSAPKALTPQKESELRQEEANRQAGFAQERTTARAAAASRQQAPVPADATTERLQRQLAKLNNEYTRKQSAASSEFTNEQRRQAEAEKKLRLAERALAPFEHLSLRRYATSALRR